MFDLFSIGELMRLTTIELNEVLKPGETNPYRKVQHMIGNDAAIVAIIASQLGLKVEFCSNSISKFDGQVLINILQHNGINPAQINTSGSYTPTNYCTIDKSGNRTWLPPCNDIFPTLPDSKINANYVYIDFYEEALKLRLKALSRIVHQNQRIFINLSATSIDHKLSLLDKQFRKKIDVLQLSSSQKVMEAKNTAENILSRLSLNAVIITLGENGSILCTANGVSMQKKEPQNSIIRTMGAGATFSAAFICGLTKGYTYEEAHNFATIKSIEFCCSKYDPLKL